MFFRLRYVGNKTNTEIGQNKAVPLRRRFRENQSSALRCNKCPERFKAHQKIHILEWNFPQAQTLSRTSVGS